jgi:hypothetical protein
VYTYPLCWHEQQPQQYWIYGYNPQQDVKELTAKQIAQMIWYFIDGKSRSKQEIRLEERSNFNEFHTAFAEVDTVFLQSRKTNRWWMQMPDKNSLPAVTMITSKPV